MTETSCHIETSLIAATRVNGVKWHAAPGVDFWIIVTASRNAIPCYKNHFFCHTSFRGTAGKPCDLDNCRFQKCSNSRLMGQVTKNHWETGFGIQDSGVRGGTAYFFLVSAGRGGQSATVGGTVAVAAVGLSLALWAAAGCPSALRARLRSARSISGWPLGPV